MARHEGADGVYHGFAQAYKALDAEQLAENYTDQAVYLQPDGSNVIGRSSIHAGFRTFFSRLEPEDSDLTISFVVKHRWIGADQVVDRGQYTLWRGERIQQRGGFLTIVVPDRDRWRFRLDALIKLP